MAAYAGADAGSGKINFVSGSIDSSTSSAVAGDHDGAITVIAPRAISVSAITSGNTNLSAPIIVTNANLSGAITANSSGAITNGAIVVVPPVSSSGAINVKNIEAAGSTVTISSGNFQSIGLSVSGGVSHPDAGTITISNGGARGIVKIAMRPVAFVQSASSLRMNDTEFGASNMLVKPTQGQPALIRAGEARIGVESGSAAFVISHNGVVFVLGLHDRATGDISVAIGETVANLRAGDAIVLRSTNEQSLSDAVLAHLPIREMREHVLLNGKTSSTCEFSLPAAMSMLNPIKQLASSANAADRALYAKILKNASALQTVNARKGAYQILRAKQIAMN